MKKLLILSVFAAACNEPQVQQPEIPSPQEVKERMVEVNKGWTINEEQAISNYVRRKKLNMIQSGTGLRYMVYEKADSTLPTAQPGDRVKINYEIYLIEGDTMVYSSEGIPESFSVAMDYVENGLHEAMTYLREGEKAKVILPYSKAYGLIGDLENIPPQAPLLYDIHLLKISR